MGTARTKKSVKTLRTQAVTSGAKATAMMQMPPGPACGCLVNHSAKKTPHPPPLEERGRSKYGFTYQFFSMG